MESCPSETIPRDSRPRRAAWLWLLSATPQEPLVMSSRGHAPPESLLRSPRGSPKVPHGRRLVVSHPVPGSPGLALAGSVATDPCDANAPSLTRRSDAADAQPCVHTPAPGAPSSADGFRSHFCAPDSATFPPVR